jgi:hypothetical protein
MIVIRGQLQASGLLSASEREDAEGRSERFTAYMSNIRIKFKLPLSRTFTLDYFSKAEKLIR